MKKKFYYITLYFAIIVLIFNVITYCYCMFTGKITMAVANFFSFVALLVSIGNLYDLKDDI